MRIAWMNTKFGGGRPDICMVYKEKVGVIIELKFNEKSAQKAIDQIKEKKYIEGFRTSTRTTEALKQVIIIGMNLRYEKSGNVKVELQVEDCSQEFFKSDSQ